MLDNVLSAADILAEQDIEATVLRLLTVSDLPARELLEQMSAAGPVIIVEEACTGSGIKEALAWEIHRLSPDCTVLGIDLGPDYVPHGSQEALYQCCGVDAKSIAGYTKEVLSK